MFKPGWNPHECCIKKYNKPLGFHITAREERLERPTPGFGDQCSTN